MKHIYIAILLVLGQHFASANENKNLAPSATITGGTTVCQNAASPTITFTGSGGTAPYTFTYHINTGPALSISTTGANSSVTLSVSTANFGTYTYSLDSVHDATLPVVEQPSSGTAVFTVNPQPDATLNSSATPDVFGGFPVFKVCANQTTQIDFFNASTTLGANTNYSISWGDGSPNFSSPNWSTLTHSYSVGLWTLVYTINAQNGCNIVKTFKVFVGNNPAVGLGNPGNTDVCISTPLTFPITGTQNNPPGTTYTVTFNDGSTPITFNHPPPADVTHTFLISSCGVTSIVGSSYQNSFYASIVATNPCDVSSATVVPIRISTPPIANFTLPQTIKCINSQVCLTNTSTGGDAASSTTCSTPKIIWTITPNSGFTLASGNLGSDLGSANTNAWTSGSNSICPIFSTPGNYTITMKIGNRCGIDVMMKIICIEPPLVPQFALSPNTGCTPLAVTTTNSTSLTNQCSPPTYAWTVSYASGNCGSASAFTYTGGTSAASANPSFNFTEPGTYSITLATTNSCGTVPSATQSVTVKKPPTVSIAAIPNFCGTANITPTATVNPCAPTSSTLAYAWSFPGGTPATSNAPNPGTINYPTNGNYTVSLVVSNECGPSNNATQTFIVNTAPVITNTNLSQTICSGSPTTLVTLTANPAGTTFTWTATATAGIAGFISSGTNTIPVQTITTTNSAAGTVTYVIRPFVGGCEGTAVNYVINVNPAPSINNQPTPSTVCLGGTPATLLVTLNSSAVTPTYQWYSNTNNATTGGTLIAGATNSSFNPPATVAGTLYYYCVISLSSGGCSSIISTTAAVVITPLPSVTTQPTLTQNLCVGVTIPTALSANASGGTGTVSYQWYSNASNTASGGTLISGATDADFTPPVFTSAGNYYYYATINYTGNGCGAVTTTTAEVLVFNDPIISMQPLATQTVCQNGVAANLQITASGGNGTFSYQWYSNTVNNTTTGTLITSATVATYSPPTGTVGTKYYYCIVSQTTSGCSVTSTTATVIINVSPTITTQPASSTICTGGIPTTLSLAYTNGVGTPTYQWFSNTSNSNVGGTAITGQTSATYTPSGSASGIFYYYCEVTFPSISGSCATIATSTAIVTVNPPAVIDIQPLASQSLCVGGTIITPLTVNVTGATGTITYQWYSNSTNSTVGGTPVGINSTNYTPLTFTTTGTTYYYVVITSSGNGCGAIASNFAQVIVVPDPSITTQPITSQTVCQNTAPSDLTVVVSGGAGSSYVYQWYSSLTNDTTSGNAIAGATSNIYTPLTGTSNTTYYYCLITQPNGLGCNVTSATGAIIVNLSPTITTQPTSSTICSGGIPTTLSLAYANGVGTPTYQWFSNTSNSNVGGTAITGQTSATYIPSGSASGIFYYYCEVTFPSISGSCATIATSTAIVTVNPPAVIEINPQPSQTLCVGGTIDSPLTVQISGVTGVASYQWFVNTTNSNAGGTLISGATNVNYTPPVYNTSSTYYYYVIISFSANGCGAITSNVAQVLVVNDPILTAQPITTQTVCQNDSATVLSVTASGGIAASYNYQWFSATSNTTTSGTLIAGETNNTFTPPTNSAGTVYYYCEITQPTGTGCNATSATAEVITNLAPAIVTQPASSIICVNATPTLLAFTYSNGVGSPTYQWYSNTSNSITGGIIISGATTATYAPSSANSGTTYYYCVTTFPSLLGGCSIITTNPAEVIVNDNPIIASVTATICSTNTFTILPTATGTNIVPAGTTYTWSTPTINPAGSTIGASLEATPQINISQTLINTTTNPATITYTVTPTSGTCVGPTFTITVTVNPSINPNVVVTNNTCFGVNSASITTNITGGIPFSSGPTYQITWTGPNGFTSTAPSISNIVPGNYDLDILDAGNCPFHATYIITQPADIEITVDSENDITCFNAANGSINLSVTGGTGNYIYTWTKNAAPYPDTTQDLANLAPGTYAVSVTDANNCGPKTATFTITQPPLLVVSLVSQTNILCYGAATGEIEVNVVGGTLGSGYDFAWTGPNGFTSNTQNLTTLLAGTYNLTVTDANACQKNITVTLTQSTEIIIGYTTTPITCYGANNASLTVTLSGGNAPYQYQWSNLATTLNQTNLSAGNYTITVTDNVGCPKILTINIPEAPVFMVNPIVANISCFGAHNGSINLNLTGGIAPVALAWADGSTAGLIRNNLGPGTYTATISDGTPCYIIRTFTIIEPLPIVLSANTTNAFNCTNANSGAIDLIVAGGTPPFTYSWSNGSTSQDLNNITSGNYLVTVTDANGCTKTAQYPITRPDPITLTIATQTTFDCAAHSVNQNFIAQASGGIPGYSFQWSSGTVSGVNNEIMHSDANGTVLVTATDTYGCTATQTVVVNTPVLGYPSFDTTSIGYSTYGIYAIGDPIQFQSTITGDYLSVSWNFGDGTFSTDLNPIHTYVIPKDYVVTQTVTYPFGCVYVQTITLIVEKGYILVVPTAFTPNGDTINDTFRPVTKMLKNVRLDVYDTWGSIIYSETGEVLVGWDAKIKGFNAENGNYYAKVTAETFYGTVINENQTFVLIK